MQPPFEIPTLQKWKRLGCRQAEGRTLHSITAGRKRSICQAQGYRWRSRIPAMPRRHKSLENRSRPKRGTVCRCIRESPNEDCAVKNSRPHLRRNPRRHHPKQKTLRKHRPRRGRSRPIYFNSTQTMCGGWQSSLNQESVASLQVLKCRQYDRQWLLAGNEW